MNYDNLFNYNDLKGQTEAYTKGYAQPYYLNGSKNQELEFWCLTGEKDEEGDEISQLVRVWTDHQGNIVRVLNPRS